MDYVRQKIEVNYLDTTTTINRVSGSFCTRTFQKAMNLFLYIPARLSHPPELVKSIIFGLLETYQQQSLFTKGYICMVELLFQQFLNRGYKDTDIVPVFSKAGAQIEGKDFRFFTPTTSSTSTLNEKRVFFHYEYHKRDISVYQRYL